MRLATLAWRGLSTRRLRSSLTIIGVALGVAHVTGTEILDLLWDSCDRLGQTIVLVTHDARAAAYADRVLVVRDGTIRDEIQLGRRTDHEARPLITRLAALGL
jgi:ABC-type dipeptide/oligopeptide/nickel transport system ATPase component